MEQVMYKGSKSQVSGANKFTKNGLNGVPVARLGLILGEDGATASRKLLRYLAGPKNKTKKQKIYQKLPIYRPGGRYVIIRTWRLQCRYDTSVIKAINLFKIGAVARVW